MSIYSYAFENGNHNEDKDGGHEGNVINRQTNDTRSFELLALLSVLVSQFSSVAQSCPTLCDPMDCSTPGFLVFLYLLEFPQIYVHWVSDAI